MANAPKSDQGNEKKPWRVHSDMRIGLGIVAVSAIFLWRTFSFPASTWDALGMSFWPRVLLGGLVLVALILMGRSLNEPLDHEPLNWRAFATLGLGLVYVFCLNTLGFILSTPFFIFLAVLLLGWPPDRKILGEAIVVSLVLTATVYFIFEKALAVTLPQGLLD